jgi:aminomethyltransferase
LSADTPLTRTPLYDAHKRAGARLIDFGGWEMPVQYKLGILKEHKAVREAVGLFDVCHMGEVSLRGAKAAAAAQKLVTGDVAKLDDGAALYTFMCLENGGIVDDCIVYRRSSDDYLIILNAANRGKDLAWIRDHAEGAEIVDEGDDTGLIAVQGPGAVELVDSLSSDALADVGRFRFAMADVAGVKCMVARTGYTGEDGFELACPAAETETLWEALLAGGEGVQPIGLGARDTLRLEAKLSLYGNDIDETTTPYEACLGWAVKLDSGPFVGSEALSKQKAEGVKRKLVGFTLEGRGFARHGYEIVDRERDGDPVLGKVTSGTKGPTVDKAIGLGYVPSEYAKSGTRFTVDCRGKDISATVHKGPFYKRS